MENHFLQRPNESTSVWERIDSTSSPASMRSCYSGKTQFVQLTVVVGGAKSS